MKQHYDFSNAKPNPYGKQLAKQVTIRMDADTLAYFQDLATEFGIPHQTLVNMYLRECAGLGLRPVWLVKTVAMKTTSRTARPKRRAS